MILAFTLVDLQLFICIRPVLSKILILILKLYIFVGSNFHWFISLSGSERSVGSALIGDSATFDASVNVARDPEEVNKNPQYAEILVDSGVHRYRVEGLQPATWYSFLVVAQNHVGRSLPSGPVRHRTHEEKPSAHPTNIQVHILFMFLLWILWHFLLNFEIYPTVI